ncbi:MAG: hypothetical protein E7612_01430 [Ruminococcaceae bacterium]|nr:hypothetical protein [Oscillospiraceae bacterium]
MKIRMLGTGYGECKTRKKSSKDFRRRGGVLIDEKILIDAPEDIFEVAEDLGFSDMFDKVCEVIISHSHPSHFSVATIEKLSKKNNVRVYATGKVLDLIPDTPYIEKIKLSTSLPMEIGEYKLYSLAANHATDIKGEMCLNFVLSRDKSLLYAVDGGGISFSAWKTLSQLKIDAVIAECALEAAETSFATTYHNNSLSAKTLRDILISGEICTESSKFVLTHIPTDRKRSVHDDLALSVRAYGMSVAYDGYFFSV